MTDDRFTDEPEPDLDKTTGSQNPVEVLSEPPRPVNWNLLTADDLEIELLELNRWVRWLCRTYGLPASVVPPLWHRHWELIWELSSLHLHWLCAYDPDQDGSAPLGWHRDFADTRQRLRDWVTAAGTRLDRDRPTRQTVWPGDEPIETAGEMPITDRDGDFVEFVMTEVDKRRRAEDEFYASLDPNTGELR
ncbi:hypothetical protein [Aeromicrobium piscarium]|uniref:DUF4913 domain-containing protein n=1 Tax=Aeromicrobium piscarium TaxID=2590901 RepID=A0A554S7U3_9ACTN|nr:hypothetical protein [Aeromicrobium piscarium]TSD62418.1 hypothetical protein FNM00_12390 [Aeromicrobium piscarium]